MNCSDSNVRCTAKISNLFSFLFIFIQFDFFSTKVKINLILFDKKIKKPDKEYKRPNRTHHGPYNNLRHIPEKSMKFILKLRKIEKNFLFTSQEVPL